MSILLSIAYYSETLNTPYNKCNSKLPTDCHPKPLTPALALAASKDGVEHRPDQLTDGCRDEDGQRPRVGDVQKVPRSGHAQDSGKGSRGVGDPEEST